MYAAPECVLGLVESVRDPRQHARVVAFGRDRAEQEPSRFRRRPIDAVVRRPALSARGPTGSRSAAANRRSREPLRSFPVLADVRRRRPPRQCGATTSKSSADRPLLIMHQAVELPNNQFVSTTREFQRLARGRSSRTRPHDSRLAMDGRGIPRSGRRPSLVAVFGIDSQAASSRLPRPPGWRLDPLACVRWKRAGVALREWGEDRPQRAECNPYSSSFKTSAPLARSSSQVRPKGVNSQIPWVRSSISTCPVSIPGSSTCQQVRSEARTDPSAAAV